ncbi:MAG: uncharacterized protein PWP08_1579 [Methanofollis sp.]|nr:uncharacterized protein [Methanofollis sp.]
MKRSAIETNHLVDEKSPYLRQHAHNPVDWYPWGKEAFLKAKEEDRPIFLSIGYSTCHWCHVMAGESFEDPEVARLINEGFVAVKVDREERPDVDAVYMQVCLALTGRGGWPLTIVMTPEKLPFFAATYLPKETRLGVTGLLDLLPKIHGLWNTRRDDLAGSAKEIAGNLSAALGSRQRGTAGLRLVRQAYEEMKRRYDPLYGGFDRFPKFPSPHMIVFLIRYWKWSGEPAALAMAEETLRQIRNGGVFDQIGSGVHRYATDRKWLVPHFEKMLYDQAMLSLAFTEAHVATGDAFYLDAAEEIFAYVRRDLASPEGAFYAAEDADSEGVEGKFYLWTPGEVRSAVGVEDAALFLEAYGIGRPDTFREDEGGQILRLVVSPSSLSRTTGLAGDEIERRLESARKKLFSVRNNRIRPNRDEKILLDWNALMIASLARAGRLSGEKKHVTAGTDAARFLLGHLRGPDGKLLHRYMDGEAAVSGMLADYAALAWALAELYQASFDPAILDAACGLADEMIARFEDTDGGGFYTVPEDAEQLIFRQKEIYDGASPSGNSLALMAFVTLFHLTGAVRYERAATFCFEAFAGEVGKNPSAHAWYMTALLAASTTSYDLVIAGEADDPATGEFFDALGAAYLPNLTVVLKDRRSADTLEKIAPHTAALSEQDGKAAAYLCRGAACDRPVTDPEDLKKLLEEDLTSGE